MKSGCHHNTLGDQNLPEADACLSLVAWQPESDQGKMGVLCVISENMVGKNHDGAILDEWTTNRSSSVGGTIPDCCPVSQFKHKNLKIICLILLGDKERLWMETYHRKECQCLFLQRMFNFANISAKPILSACTVLELSGISGDLRPVCAAESCTHTHDGQAAEAAEGGVSDGSLKPISEFLVVSIKQHK